MSFISEGEAVRERIEELAKGINSVVYLEILEIDKGFLPALFNEALELAARECERSDKSTHPSDCAAAIRKLKVG